MKLRPLGDSVVVKKPVAKEEATKSGIILTESARKSRSEQGEVVAVGPGRLLENGSLSPMNVKVGDVVLFKGYPEEVKLDDVEYLVVAESDVIGVIE